MKYIIEGIDRLGKSTLTQNIQEELGYHLVIHYDKPKKLKYYEDLKLKIENAEGDFRQVLGNSDPLYQYQRAVNRNMFDLIENSKANIIFDRGHLGECVYAPLYRKYSGDYVYDYESLYDISSVKLILLTTSNFDICVDDGEGFNFDNKEREQELFKSAFEKSSMDKVLIDVHNGQGSFKDPQEILKEALSS